jgi:hypothetical protein
MCNILFEFKFKQPVISDFQNKKFQILIWGFDNWMLFWELGFLTRVYSEFFFM